MRRLIPALAVLLAYAISPGAGEITENIAHYLLDGHAAHAPHEADQLPSGDAHGCSGPFQTCPCHGTSAFAAEGAPVQIDVAEVHDESPSWFVAALRGDDVSSSVFRPPIA